MIFRADSAPAASQGPSAWQLLAGCAEKVQELEAEVASLQKQLRDQRRAAARYTSAGQASGAPPPGDCDIPFEISPDGIKLFKEHCVEALHAESCEVPYVLDERGLKSVKRACIAE